MNRHNKGITLIEIIVAMLILSFGIAASLKLFAVLDERLVTSSYFYTATNLARDVIEFGESVDFFKEFKMLYKHSPGEKDYGSGVNTSEGYGLKEWKNFDPADSIHPFALMGEIQEKELVPTETPESVEIYYEVKEDNDFYKAYRQDINVSWNVKGGEQDEIKVAAIPITTNNQLKLEIQDFWWEKGKDLPVVPPPPPNKAPIANISADPTFGNAPLRVEFSGAGSEDPDGSIVSYSWNFGDGNTGIGKNITHTYASKGTYTASLTVTDDDGETDTANVNIKATKVPPPLQPPIARISANPASGKEPLMVEFDGSGSYDPDGSIVPPYSWNFGDGHTGTGVTVEHIYASKGTYTASLTVTDNDGKTDTASVSIQVSKAPLKPPTAIISANPTSGDAPLTVSFDGSGSINGDGSIVSYKWVFGDGGIATGAKKTHTYDTKGTYTASLTVTDNNRLKNTASVKITADESGPITKIFNITSPPIWVNDKYPIRTKTIDIPKADEYDLWIQAEYTGESQIGEEYRLQVNGGSIGPIIGDRYNGPNDPTLKWISHGSYNLREGANTITFHKGGQPNRIGTGDPGDWRDYDPSDDPSLWTWYLGGSVHFKAIKIKTSE